MTEAFLIIVISWAGGQDIYANKMPTMQTCNDQLQSLKTVAPRGNEQEHVVISYCTPTRLTKRRMHRDGDITWE